MGIYRGFNAGHMGIYRKSNPGHMGIYGKISKLWIILERMLWASSMDHFGKNVMGFVYGSCWKECYGLRGATSWAHGPMGPWAQGPWAQGPWAHGTLINS